MENKVDIRSFRPPSLKFCGFVGQSERKFERAKNSCSVFCWKWPFLAWIYFYSLQAAYNRFVAAFSRIWSQYRENDEDSNEAELSTKLPPPEIAVKEVPDLTLVPSSATAIRLREGTSRSREARELFRRSYYALRSGTDHLRKRSPRRMGEIRLNNSRTMDALVQLFCVILLHWQ